MKRTGKSAFFIVALLIVALAFTSFFGIYSMNGDIEQTHIRGAKDIRWGIDIRGGVEATYSPVEDIDATTEQINAAKNVIETRMVKAGITDYEVYTNVADSSIIVRFPWKADEADFDPESAAQELAATAVLTFREGVETTQVQDEDGSIINIPTGATETVVLEGKDVASAAAIVGQDSTYQVSLELTAEGKTKFSQATSRLVGSQISIWMDNDLISAPTVNEAITDGNAVISGSFTASEASDLADKINAGALPFSLKITNYDMISPTLGSSALQAMLLAGVIALLIIIIFLIFYYRLPGVVASIALIGQVAGIIACISGYFPFFNSFTLTIPGIAGIILSIGIGVDANVITNERILENMRMGKTIDGSIHYGNKQSFSAIFDGNITNIIVAVVLMGVFGPPDGILGKIFNAILFMFGTSTTGVVYSFGYTLFIGVIFNFIMAIFASRIMLTSISGFKLFRNKKFYGGANK